jgi:hypothetical protein
MAEVEFSQASREFQLDTVVAVLVEMVHPVRLLAEALLGITPELLQVRQEMEHQTPVEVVRELLVEQVEQAAQV